MNRPLFGMYNVLYFLGSQGLPLFVTRRGVTRSKPFGGSLVVAHVFVQSCEACKGLYSFFPGTFWITLLQSLVFKNHVATPYFFESGNPIHQSLLWKPPPSFTKYHRDKEDSDSERNPGSLASKILKEIQKHDNSEAHVQLHQVLYIRFSNNYAWLCSFMLTYTCPILLPWLIQMYGNN